MKNFIANQLNKTSKDRIFKYIGAGGLLLLAIIIFSFLYCAAQWNKQKHLANVMRIQHQIAEREKDVKCYEILKDATHLYFNIYRSRSGMNINVGDDDKGACKALEARKKSISQSYAKN